MANSINTSYAVIVLGDTLTIERADLVDKAAEHGAVITETYSFEPGEAASHDDVTEVEAVVAALSRAIATHTDLWVPFPMDDLGREQHVRRVSLVMQREGLNMLMGHDLEPCTMEGGFNEIDFALRAEVRAVDALHYAAVAAAGVSTLLVEIERELIGSAPAAQPAAPVALSQARPVPSSVEGEPTYGTAAVARFFGKSMRWLYYAMRLQYFTYPDGSPIETLRDPKTGYHRFTVPMLREMAMACYRRGILAEGECLDLLAVLTRAESE
jgi:hypothetical protein